ncbi:MAG: hypothetical protein ACREMY_00175 [bacterium]
MNPALAAWAVEAGIITIRDLATSKRFPLPSEFLATFIVFGTLTALGGTASGRRPAAAVAWGLVVATALASQVDFLKPVGDFLAPSKPTQAEINQVASMQR